MTVYELIETLKEYDENDEILISADEEGNSYRPISDICSAKYSKSGTEYYLESDDDDEGTPCAVFF